MGRRLAWDVESDGFLETLTRVHCLCIEDVDTGETWAFRQNDRENTILDGVAMLNEADLIIGHSSVSFWHVTRKLERELIEQVRDLRVENVALRHQISSLNSFIFPAVRPRTRSERLGDRRRSDEAWAKSWRVRWTGEAK